MQSSTLYLSTGEYVYLYLRFPTSKYPNSALFSLEIRSSIYYTSSVDHHSLRLGGREARQQAPSGEKFGDPSADAGFS